MQNKKFGVIDKIGNIIININYDGIKTSTYSQEVSDYCKQEGCNKTTAYASEYCYDHKPSTAYKKYCKAYGCLNKVAYSWNDYCLEHSYLEY